MQFIITAPDLTKPTYETLEERVKKKFSKLEKRLPKTNQREYEVRITVRKAHDVFELTADIVDVDGAFSSVKDRDLRKAVDSVASTMKNNLSKGKERKISLKRAHKRIKSFLKRKEGQEF